MRLGSVTCENHTGSHQMVYREWGDKENARVLICVHGLTRNSMDFYDLAESLSESYRVICPDIVGRGQSDWLPEGTPYELGQYIKDLNSIIAKLQLSKVDWLGTSMGGILGMIMASVPDTPIKRLVLNDVGCYVKAEALQRIQGYIGVTEYKDIQEVETAVRNSFLSYADLTDEQWLRLAECSVREISGGFTQHYDPEIVKAFSAGVLSDIDLTPWFSAIKIPMMLIYGGESDIVSEEVLKESLNLQPSMNCVRVPNAPHAPALMEPDQINAIKRWLVTD